MRETITYTITDRLACDFATVKAEGIPDGWLQDSWFVGLTPQGEAVYIMDAEIMLSGPLGHPVPGFFVSAYTLVDGYPTGDEEKMRALTEGPVMLEDAIAKARAAIEGRK